MTRRDKALALLKMHGRINSLTVSAALGVSRQNASDLMLTMEKRGDIKRIGERGPGKQASDFVEADKSGELAFGVEDSVINRYLMGAL